jgi:RimJ/RimL family protein N-acetyltransferase
MLEGKKINLRPLEERDLNLVACWRNDSANRRFFFTTSMIYPGGQKKWFENLLIDPNRFVLVIETKEGQAVGIIGLDKIDRRNQEAEGGPGLLDSNERGKGYMEEAIELLLDYAFGELNLHRVYGTCYPFNRTIELLKWYGFQQEGVLRQAVFTQGKFYDKVILGLLREEWQNDRFSDGHHE